jgi:mRNA-degrading endonuclease RelE of RelBE toxin-antitoxin system
MPIETTSWFNKQLKQLAKKYKSIPADYANLLNSLVENPLQGTPIRRGAFKIECQLLQKVVVKVGEAA